MATAAHCKNNKSSRHDNDISASQMTEQGRRMSEAISGRDDEYYVNEKRGRNTPSEDDGWGGNVGIDRGSINSSRHSNVAPKESALLRDQSNLVKDAFKGNGRVMVSEFSLPRTSSQEDGEGSTNDGSSTEVAGATTGHHHRCRRQSWGATQDIATKENARVYYAKLLVFLVLCLSAAAVAYLTYWYISSEEEQDAIQQFRTDANEILDVSNANGRNILAVLEIFSTLLSSAAAEQARLLNRSDNIWPTFSLADFEQFGSDSRALSGALLLAYTPLVPHASRAAWESYSVANQGWIDEGLEVLGYDSDQTMTRDINEFIYRKTTRTFESEVNFTNYSPIWQLSPAPVDTSIVNFNLQGHPTFERLAAFSDFTRQAALSEVVDTSLLFGTSAPKNTRSNDPTADDPQSIALLPIFQDSHNPSSTIVGHVVAVIPWGQFLSEILAEDRNQDVYVVLEESCGKVFTYVVNGPSVTYIGPGDQHDRSYSDERIATDFNAQQSGKGLSESAQQFLQSTYTKESPHCEYKIAVYPSAEYMQYFETNDPLIFSMVVLSVFVFTSAVFLLYDVFVTRRQAKVQSIATRSTAIVTSLFPAQIRDKLYQDQEDKQQKGKEHKTTMSGYSNKAYGLTSHAALAAGMGMATNDEGSHSNSAGTGDDLGLVDDSPPIADLFPSATVLFMDIAGFTAWSSSREPSQVFILLETIYRSFDKIAKQRRVFKVETIGDCYVAVCGLPEPNDFHAVVMARFARDCMEKMNELARKLETTLGPDTADLAMRAGLHSGAVTAGVLRGERARFQLFGDTVNTAARMESTGIKKKIQISQETAELIMAANKGNWIKARDDIVHAKGKGELQTFWLLPKHKIGQSPYAVSEGTSEAETDLQSLDGNSKSAGDDSSARDDTSVNSATELTATENERVQRLVDYTTDILLHVLRRIEAKRRVRGETVSEDERLKIKEMESTMGQTDISLREVVEVIELPGFDSAAYSTKNVQIDPEAVSELGEYVKMIASMYRGNPFHNFDHASHVTQSVSKLLSRIVAVKHIEEAEELHDHTYGITSDPLTQFAIVFSSLVHDVDHRGVPNFLLVKEDPALGALYKNQAVAEQNSVDVAWNLLMDPMFDKLRAAIYSKEAELRRFRQLVVNSLMATDIFDKELSGLRKQRWEKAFHADHSDEDSQVSINRKATIAIEHIIQASDVSHTMQHWHVYNKWNAKLYHEMFLAYCQGRTSKDPTEGWYNGELWFFDNYVIPLAHKLKECGVFGVSSDEYLQYALSNRKEWESRGKTIAEENFEQFKGELDHRPEEIARRSSTQEAAPLPTHE